MALQQGCISSVHKPNLPVELQPWTGETLISDLAPSFWGLTLALLGQLQIRVSALPWGLEQGLSSRKF